ncbi:hypothetical protein IMY05_C4724000200 [Salix suchowensis]|nr:hypothetical protein IMY05_C4724000200 [Salix suchowensis]
MSEKQRMMLAQQQQQQNLQQHPQNFAANHPNLPSPYGSYGAGGQGVHLSPPPTSTSTSPTTATFSNEGSGFNAYEGYPTSNDHSSSAGTSDGSRSNAMARNAAMGALGAGVGAAAVGGAGAGGRGNEETESNYSTNVSAYGPVVVGGPGHRQAARGDGGVYWRRVERGRVVANPDEDDVNFPWLAFICRAVSRVMMKIISVHHLLSYLRSFHPLSLFDPSDPDSNPSRFVLFAAPRGPATQRTNASHVLVHHDGGRVPQAQNTGGDVDEIPPTYESIVRD